MGLPKQIRDWLALIVIVGMPVIWVAFTIPEAALGTSMAGWMLVIQFFFRRAGPDVTSGGTDGTATQHIPESLKSEVPHG